MLMLLPLNIAHNSVTLHLKESYSPKLVDTLLEDASRLDSRKQVVLLQGGSNLVYIGSLELR